MADRWTFIFNYIFHFLLHRLDWYLPKGLDVTVNTIDSCQGKERDIVIISIARTRGIGFLAIRQRLNVALTRAKKMLILCGNFNSLQVCSGEKHH